MYDRLAGVKNPNVKMLSKQETLNKEPLVKRDGLKGGGYYVEYRTDDARLTIEVMKKLLKMEQKSLIIQNQNTSLMIPIRK